MQAVCDILEQLLQEGILKQYAIGGATAAGFHGEPLATRDIDVFVFVDPTPGQLLVTLAPVFARLTCSVKIAQPCGSGLPDTFHPTRTIFPLPWKTWTDGRRSGGFTG